MNARPGRPFEILSVRRRTGPGLVATGVEGTDFIGVNSPGFRFMGVENRDGVLGIKALSSLIIGVCGAIGAAAIGTDEVCAGVEGTGFGTVSFGSFGS